MFHEFSGIPDSLPLGCVTNKDLGGSEVYASRSVIARMSLHTCRQHDCGVLLFQDPVHEVPQPANDPSVILLLFRVLERLLFLFNPPWQHFQLSTVFLWVSVFRQCIGLAYLFPPTWRKVLEVTVFMMCNFPQPVWCIDLSISPGGALE